MDLMQSKRNLNASVKPSTQYPPIIQDVNRGGITFDGYIFHRNTVIKKGAVYYRCSKSRTLRCPATLIVYADGSAKPNKKPHNHARKKPKELQFAENRDGSPQSAPQYPPSIIQDVRRGGIALDGYHFQRRVIKEGVNYYRCSQSRTLRCPANLNVYADGSVKPNKKSHNHGRKPVNEFAGKKLWFKGYSFCKDTKNGIRNKMQWKCTNKSCSVRLNTDISGNVVFIRGVHAHAAPIFPSIFVMKFSRIIEIKKNKSTK